MELEQLIGLLLGAIVIGIVCAIVFLKHTITQSGAKTVDVSNHINTKYIQELILPNNMGKPIETVVANLEMKKVNLEFNVDCYREH